MPQDAIYAQTRRMKYPSNGVFPTVTRQTAGTYDTTTGIVTPTEVVTTVRWMSMEHTKYSMFVRATATTQKVGEVTFLIWLKDVEAIFTALDSEDFITFEGVRYDVVSSERYKTGLLITATEQRGGSR